MARRVKARGLVLPRGSTEIAGSARAVLGVSRAVWLQQSCFEILRPVAEDLTSPGLGTKEGFCTRRGLANHLVGKRPRQEYVRDQGP